MWGKRSQKMKKGNLLALAALLSLGAVSTAKSDALVVSVTVDIFTDGGPAWQTALIAAGVTTDLFYDTQTNGWPDLSAYDLVVIVYNDTWWEAGLGAFSSADEVVMAAYTGNLVIIGQDYIFSLGGLSPWMAGRFGIVSVIQDVNFGDDTTMTLTGSAGGPFEGLVANGTPCWAANPWFTDDVTVKDLPTQDWSTTAGFSGHGGAAVSDGIFSSNAYECFADFQDWVDAIVAFFAPNPCPADLVVDGVVGVKDLLFLLGTWGPCPKQGDCPADLVVDGVVGVKDLLFLLGAWGPCP